MSERYVRIRVAVNWDVLPFAFGEVDATSKGIFNLFVGPTSNQLMEKKGTEELNVSLISAV